MNPSADDHHTCTCIVAQTVHATQSPRFATTGVANATQFFYWQLTFFLPTKAENLDGQLEPKFFFSESQALLMTDEKENKNTRLHVTNYIFYSLCPHPWSEQ